MIAKSDKPEWAPLDRFYISPSQIDTFELCNRKWWFGRIAKLPEPHKPHFAFGTALHGCLERWILSTPNGRVPLNWDWKHDSYGDGGVFYLDGPFINQTIGEPTDLFPPGFETITERDGYSITLTPNEVGQIKRLVKEAIEKGIITKGDDIEIESAFTLPLIDNVYLTGRIDLVRLGDQPEIRDHKSFGKSSIRYLKQPGPKRSDGTLIPIVRPLSESPERSPNCVGDVQQNLSYAWAFVTATNFEGPVLVGHNQFPKFPDPKGVRHVQALLSPIRIKAHGKYLQGVAKRMVRVSKIKKWEDTPPPSTPDACSDYGGCHFLDICSHRINPSVYLERTVRNNKRLAEKARPNFPLDKPRKGTKTMAKATVFGKAKKQLEEVEEEAPKKSAFGKGKTKPKVEEPDEDEEEEEDEEGEEEEEAPPKKGKGKGAFGKATPEINGGVKPKGKKKTSGGAPWASPDCAACDGLGLNSKGSPCPICDKVAKRNNRPSSSMYDYELDDGTFTAMAQKEHLEAILEMDAAPEWEHSTDADAPAKGKGAFGKAKSKAEPEDEEEESPKQGKLPFGKKVKSKSKDSDEEDEEEEAPRRGFGKAQEASDDEDEPEAETEGEEAPLKRGRGRPPGSKNKVTRTRELPPVNPSVGGRPRAGIKILKGVSCLKGPERPRLSAQELLESFGSEMATDMGQESFYALDPHKRRDALKQAGAELASRLERTVVTFPASCQDFDLVALFNALAPFAEEVYEGTH